MRDIWDRFFQNVKDSCWSKKLFGNTDTIQGFYTILQASNTQKVIPTRTFFRPPFDSEILRDSEGFSIDCLDDSADQKERKSKGDRLDGVSGPYLTRMAFIKQKNKGKKEKKTNKRTPRSLIIS